MIKLPPAPPVIEQIKDIYDACVKSVAKTDIHDSASVFLAQKALQDSARAARAMCVRNVAHFSVIRLAHQADKFVLCDRHRPFQVRAAKAHMTQKLWFLYRELNSAYKTGVLTRPPRMPIK